MRIATASLIVVLAALLVFWGCKVPKDLRDLRETTSRCPR